MRALRSESGLPDEGHEVYSDVVSTVGGRLSHLFDVSRHPDMRGHARRLLDVEKAGLLSRIGLIPDHDGRVNDEVCSLRLTMLIYTVHLLYKIAKVEQLLLAVALRVCEAAAGTRTAV